MENLMFRICTSSWNFLRESLRVQLFLNSPILVNLRNLAMTQFPAGTLQPCDQDSEICLKIYNKSMEIFNDIFLFHIMKVF